MNSIFENLKSFFASGLGVVSAVIAILTSIVTLLERFTKLKELIGYRSLTDKIHEEEACIAKAIEFIKGLEFQNTEESRAMHATLQISLNLRFERLAALTDRDSKLRQDPNYDLNIAQRLLLLFEPDGRTALILHSLAYICMIAIPISLFYKSQMQHQHADVTYVADTLIVACYGALVFRAWALAARRWSYAYDAKPGVWANVLVLRKPRSKWMLMAQVSFWVSIFWVIESLEDLCLDIFNHTLPSTAEGLLKSLVPLAAAVLCRLWADAELKCSVIGSNLGQRLAALLRLRWTTFAMLACIGVSAGATFLVLRMHLLDEPVHQMALVLQSLILCVACSQLLVLLSRPVTLDGEEPLPQKTESAAA